MCVRFYKKIHFSRVLIYTSSAVYSSFTVIIYIVMLNELTCKIIAICK